MIVIRSPEGEINIVETFDPEAYPGWSEVGEADDHRGEPLVMVGETVVPVLDWHKARARGVVTMRRDVAEFSGCVTPLGVMDTDAYAQKNVNGAVTAALIAQSASAEYSEDWTMADNSVVAHDAPAMIAAGLAVLAHVSACHAVARLLKEAIDVAATVADVEAVDIEGAGWP